MPLVIRLALRDLRGGLSGFGIFLACIALGVAAISGVGSVSRSLSDGLAAQGRVILGGDASFDLVQREASEAEKTFFRSRGRLAEVSVLRAMARREGGDAALVELKAVGADYPETGAVVLDPAMPIATALQAGPTRSGRSFGAVADAALAARLGLKVGDTIHIGEAAFVLRATLLQEPDKLAAGIGFGPRVIVSDSGLAATGLVQPGSLVRHLYRIALPDRSGHPASDAAVRALVSDAATAFPAAGWEARTRENVTPQFSRDIERFTQFLTLVGLTALIIGGAGVANAIRGFVERRRPSIATMKSLGATGTYVFGLMLIEVMAIAALGIAIGLAVGVALPFVVAWAFDAVLPFPLSPSVYPAQILAGLLYGTWTALAFSMAPLGRAHDIPVSALFRDQIEPDARGMRPRYAVLVALAGTGLVATILVLSQQRSLAIYYMVATAGGFVVLRVVAALLMAVARRLPHSRIVAPAARHRQHPSSRRADPYGGSLARPRPGAARRADVDRRQHPQPAPSDRGRRDTVLLLSRRTERAGAGVPLLSRDARRRRKARVRADDARGGSRRSAASQPIGSNRPRRRRGCCRATEASPSHRQCRADRRSPADNGGRPITAASRWFRSRPRSPTGSG